MIKNQFTKKVIAVLLVLNFLQTLVPYNIIYANNNGPNAPEASGFEPVSATDMVNLSSGDTSYVLPLLEIDGFPVALSYHSGIPLDMESSWVGLGWNINTGAINRGVNATPDDWNGGKSLDFINFSTSEQFYSINVGVGFADTAEVGVGISWGSNKSLSGSVYGGFAGVNASISTDGNYSVGYGIGLGESNTSNVGIGVSISGNLNSGDKTYNAGLSGRTSSGLAGSLGVSLSDSGFSLSASAGFNSLKGNGGDTMGSMSMGSISMGNYSSGDYDITSKGFYIPIQINIFSFGFGFQEVTYKLEKGYRKTGYGILYANNSANRDTSFDAELSGSDYYFSDYQNRYYYGDMYDQVLPQAEEDFISDATTQKEKINFSFAGYDSYEVNATGIAGGIQPRIFENATLFGIGHKGQFPETTNDEKMRIYYHSSKGMNDLVETSYLPQKNLYNNLNFYFNGQFTETTAVDIMDFSTSFPSNTSQLKTLKGYLDSSDRYIDNNLKRSGNFIEVFTNAHIRYGNDNNLLQPENLPREDRANYESSGIGGYKITAPDGKVYHFSLPVYHYERVERKMLKYETDSNVNEKRQYTPYATHWLLTAITGPDFVDTNQNSLPDDGDFGYWVRLDHGKWSDGYVWRSPFEGYNYSTNNESEVGKEDKGSFQFGRKDLYYLDKIVSRTQTAYFVKDLRYDAVGSDLNYKMTKPIVEDDTGSGGNPWIGEDFTYNREYQLVLDKVVIVNNKNVDVTKTNILSGLNSSLYTKNYNGIIDFNSSGTEGGFYEVYGKPTVNLHQEKNVYDVKDFENFDYSKALKVVQFKYNYRLAEGTPSSITDTKNPGKGRLTLKEVNFLGRNQYKYMPGYKFDYKGESDGQGGGFAYPVNHQSTTLKSNGNYEINKAKDEWGFIDEQYYLQESLGISPSHPDYEIHHETYSQTHGPDNWSLQTITTPTGSKIDFEYEEDDYYTEAFSRRYFNNDLKYRATYYDNEKAVEFINNPDNNVNIDFTQYFDDSKKAYIKFHYFLNHYQTLLDRHHDWASFSAYTDILLLESNRIIFRAPEDQNDSDYISTCFTESTNPYDDRNNFGHLTDVWHTTNDFSCGKTSGEDAKVKSYNILANKVPMNQTGGGLRVKSITLEDESNNKYITNYYYNNPKIVNNEVRGKFESGYESSGITSFAPVNGVKFIPYQSELPSAGVMYEYVTMQSESVNGDPLGKTVYRFHTLEKVMDIFDPNLTMYDDSGREIFNATVENANSTEDALLYGSQKMYGKKINIDVNTSLVGQFREISEYNNKNHLLKKTVKNYASGKELVVINEGDSVNIIRENRGAVRESFQNMKSIFKANSENENPNLIKRLLSVSSRVDYNSVLVSTTTSTQYNSATEEYFDADPQTGSFREIRTKLSDGTFNKVYYLPAYTQYPDMGSKVDDIKNKHMLSQNAMSITSISNDGTPDSWKTTDVSVTTWNNDWSYRDNTGVESSPDEQTEMDKWIWRKHKTYVWKGNLDNEGTLGTEITSNDFNWGVGDTQSNSEWENISEITRYTHWSEPVEAKDINGNYASSISADKYSKTIAGGNAQLTEMFYSGAENIDNDNLNYFDGEVKGSNYQTEDLAHTGKFAVQVNTNQRAFEVILKSGEHKSGKYKVSVWVEKAKKAYARININGSTKTFNGEEVPAGDWVMLNHYEDLSSGDETVYITSSNGLIYFDDFRLLPIASTMNSYVYDSETDQLTYILDANNLATRYRYDDAGRLCKIYKEVIDNSAIIGGFKMVSHYRYNYKDVAITTCQCCDAEVIDYNPVAVDDTGSINFLGLNSFNVLVNDDFGGDGASSSAIEIISSPTSGTATINTNGTPNDPTDDKIDYMPQSNFDGLVTIGYRIYDADGDYADANLVIDVDVPQYSVYFDNVTYEDPLYVTGELYGVPGSTITYRCTHVINDYGHGEGWFIVNNVSTIVEEASVTKTVTIPSLGYVSVSIELMDGTSEDSSATLKILSTTEGTINPSNELTAQTEYF